MKFQFFLSITLIFTCCTYSLKSYADIYFNAKIAGPITNISRIDDSGTLHTVSPGKRQQDRGFSLNQNGLIAYASNRPAEEKTRVQESMSIFIQSEKNSKNTGENTNKKLKNTNINKTNDSINIVQISKADEFSFSPKFSRDGKHLAYLSRDKKNTHHLYLYNIKSKNQKILLSAPQIFDFMWSQKKQRILVSLANEKSSSIQTLSITNKNTSTLIEKPLRSETEKTKGSYLISATWSPDEKWIAFIDHPLDRSRTKTANIYSMTTKKISPASNSKYQVQAPLSWSKNSQTLLYSTLIDYEVYYDEQLRDKVYKGGLHIFTSDLEGNTKKLTTGDHYYGKPVYSPDNKEIAFLFAEKLGGQLTYQLKKMEADGSNLVTLNDSVFRESFLEWR